MYVSFGSQTLLTPPVATALAEVLDQSGVPFVWVIGTGNGGVVPNRFEARAVAARRGMVVRGWAPQVSALQHTAVGWFMTHSGWNSVLEAVTAGVPMLVWPMSADQFVNARLLMDEAGVTVRTSPGGVGVVPHVGELLGGRGATCRSAPRSSWRRPREP
jgi:UDP:flavonoid glycosyltransferase YjiC (YdhE family)